MDDRKTTRGRGEGVAENRSTDGEVLSIGTALEVMGPTVVKLTVKVQGTDESERPSRGREQPKRGFLSRGEEGFLLNQGERTLG